MRTLFIEPGSPWENGYVESFNGRLRDELLDREIFYTLTEAKVLIVCWRRQYNTVRPHSLLGYRAPAPVALELLGPCSAPLRTAQAPAPMLTVAQCKPRGPAGLRGTTRGLAKWSRSGLNRRPLACHPAAKSGFSALRAQNRTPFKPFVPIDAGQSARSWTVIPPLLPPVRSLVRRWKARSPLCQFHIGPCEAVARQVEWVPIH